MNRSLCILLSLTLAMSTLPGAKADEEILKIDFDRGFAPELEVFNAKLQGDTPNKACYLDGVGDYLKLDIPYYNSDSDFSISLWVAPFSYSIASAWVSKANRHNSRSQWRLGFGWPAAQTLNVTLYGSKWDDLLTPYQLPLYQWSHLVYRLSPSNKTVQLYINGTQHDQWTFTQYASSNDPIYIGLQQDDYYFFHGMVDELVFFKGWISEERIAESYEQFKTSPKVVIHQPDPHERQIYQYHAPAKLEDGIEVGDLNTNKTDFNRLNRAMQKILDQKVDRITSLLIYQNDRLIVEEYFNNHHRDDFTRIASVTKSFTSALVGIAIDKGYIQGVDEKLTDFFPAIDFNNSCLKGITLSHLLNHTSGIEDKDIPSNRLNQGWAIALLKAQDTCRRGEFNYGEVNPDLVQALISLRTGEHSLDFAQKHLFKPLQIHEFIWPNDFYTGMPCGGTCLTLKSRDMLKFGILYLNQGRFNGTQVISTQWINQTRDDVKAGDGYHNYWTVGHDNIEGTSTPYLSAIGFGGQYIRIYPELNTVVVITASPSGEGMDPLDFVIRDVLPALL